MSLSVKLLLWKKLLIIEFKYHRNILKNDMINRAYKIEHIISMITRRCKHKGYECLGGWAYLKHSNCSYINELSNYNYCCKDCHDRIDALYQDMWDEYNAGRI